ncbi:MAG: diphosphate--fructose-6-phosphate 1-phosphotransferase, partial [Xanthomonadales bacterium]|nr:diphosphate--fructose-6-phosphate 1-phosphotransferase [Xanthomonadales bacterium]
RLADKPYQWEIATARLADMANVEKMLPRDFITEDGFGITEKCRAYMQPLIEGEAYPPYENGLPKYVRLQKKMLDKKLPKFDI